MTKPRNKPKAPKAKPVALDHHHFGVAPGEKGFDIRRARKAHADVMRRWDDPKEGDDFKAMLLCAIHSATAAQIEAHRSQIQAFLDDFHTKRSAVLSKAIIKTYVANAYQMAEEVGKDSSFERKHRRGFGGRFSTMGQPHQLPPEHQVHGEGYGPPGSREERVHRFARGEYGGHREWGRRNLAAQQALLSHAAAYQAGAKRAGAQGQKTVWHFKDKRGRMRAQEFPAGKVPKPERGETLVGHRGAGISGDEHLTMGGAVFNLAQELGAGPERAGTVGGDVGAGWDFANAWDAHTEKNYGNATGTGAAFNRIEAGSKALQTIASNSPKAQVAAVVGRFVGKHGPEAEKVLGPHARKAAYKYRGVERLEHRDLPTRAEGMTPHQYHDKLVARISRHVPTLTVHELNLASGYTAPSHGYMLDSNGKVLIEAHGYGDDHYLPFRLSGLTKMKDGSYIRTRSTGGPTTEDIFAAAWAGGKRFTVTSRQGTYQVAFDPEFKHNKRFGDIALGMSKRYGKVLDAVASGQVKAYGEVSNRQYRDFYTAARTQLEAEAEKRGEANPNIEQEARNRADEKRRQQESTQGRKLTLDGEGYDYALQSLASMYPYYLHYRNKSRPGRQGDEWKDIGPTGYTPPQSMTFSDTDERDNHLNRIGNSYEDDTGYVKYRHIKPEHALIGYFDPTINGPVRDDVTLPSHTPGIHRKEAPTTTGTGKVRGDLAFYQHWARNPYNSTPNKTEQRTGQGQRQGDQREVSATIRAPTPTQGQGGGARSAVTGQTAENDLFFEALKSYRSAFREKFGHKAQLPNELHQWSWGGDAREKFNEAWDKHPEHVKNLILDEMAKSGLTDSRITSVGRADEVADTAIARTDNLAEYNTIVQFLDDNYSNEVRNQLHSTVADAVASGESWATEEPDEKPEPDDWFSYHTVLGGPEDSKYLVRRETLLRRAFPSVSGDAGGNQNKAIQAKRQRARRILDYENRLDELYPKEGLEDAKQWVPHHLVGEVDEPDTSPPEKTEEVLGSETPQDKQRASHAEKRQRLLDNFKQALDKAEIDHRQAAKEAESDPDYDDVEWAREFGWIKAVQDKAHGLDADSDPKDVKAAMSDLEHLLKENKNIGGYTYPQLTGRNEYSNQTLRSALADLQAHEDRRITDDIERNETSKRFVLSKRADGKYLLQKAVR
jgi:hypothetical protein